jgi:hypothetical protein
MYILTADASKTDRSEEKKQHKTEKKHLKLQKIFYGIWSPES